MKRLHLVLVLALIGSMIIFSVPGQSNADVEWQELQFEYTYGTEYKQLGESINPADGTARDNTTAMSTFTMNYANIWDYGMTVVNLDIYFEESSDEVAFYTQGWEFFSLNAIFDTKKFALGPILDVQIAPGWQLSNVDDLYAGDIAQGALDAAWGAGKPVYEASDMIDLFYGINLALKVPGFTYMGFIIGVYDDFNSETDYDMQPYLNLYCGTNFDIGPTSWKLEGNIQYFGDRDSNVSSILDQQENIMSEAQIMMDVGKLIWNKANQFYVGTEIRWSMNTFGLKDVPDGFGGYITKEQNEFFPCLLVEWVF